MSRAGKHLVVGLFNVVAVLLVVEAVGIFTFLGQEGQWFYWRPMSLPPHESTIGPPPPTRLVLHPIMGFIRRPGIDITQSVPAERLSLMMGPGPRPEWVSVQANNFGFFFEYDYPYVPPDETYLIGIFGGSLAQWFALQGSAALIDRLHQSPGFEHRRIEVVNFAQGGFKQPQQLQILGYLLARGQPIDYAINIDGFNEIALSLGNIEHRIEPSLPSSQPLLDLVSLLDESVVRLEFVSTLARLKRSEVRVRQAEATMATTASAGVWLVSKLIRDWSAAALERARAALAVGDAQARPDVFHMNVWSDLGPRRDPLETIADTWMRASALMGAMLRTREIPYLHVIQPNQYYSSRQFSAAERAIAIDTDASYADSIGAGYPRLLQRVPAMRSDGINVISATAALDSTSEVVYSDGCCHLNQAGNEVLARFVADQMGSAMRARTLTGSGRRATP